MSIVTKLPAYFAALAIASSATAHEYWIEPVEYRLESGANIVANVRVGQDFKGDPYSYFPGNFKSFDVYDNNGTRPVTGRAGDRPAVDIETSADGLHILNQFSSTSRLSYEEFEKFESFVLAHGMDWVLEAHAERGLPDTGFSEGYTRFPKALIAVGDGAGQDRYTGLFFEIVAASNPYTDDISAGMPITLLLEGQPSPNTQVDIFYRTNAGDLQRSSVLTSANGTTVIPNQGDGDYMINAVHMIIPFAADSDRTGVVWHSLWASMTFQIGG